MTSNTSVEELRRLRTRVHAVLGGALAVSVAANVIAAQPTLIGRAVAGWFPVALLLVVDVLGKTPAAAGWLGRISTIATGLVAAAAAVASFTHMRHVAQTAGESELVAVLFPLSVDGTAIVCSVALVEINRQLKTWRGSGPAPTRTPTAPDPATPTGIAAADAGGPSSIAPADTAPLPVFTGPAVVNGSLSQLNREGA